MKHLLSTILATCILVLPISAQGQGLSGPSSAGADLTPGDGLTDPKFRSDFPAGALTGWTAWKNGLAEKGFKFNFDYLALGQSTDANTATDSASGGIARFYGTWQATDTGSLTFKIEHRHAYGSLAPQDLGLAVGALSFTGTAFNDKGALLTNLYWTERASDGAWTFQIGQIDVTDFLNVYGLVSPYTAFQNLAFNTGSTVNPPDPGLGIAGGVRLGSNFYAVASVSDANSDPHSPDFDVFSHGNLFKSLEIGYTSSLDRIYFDNIHLTYWHRDSADDGSRAEDSGVNLSAAWFIDNTWMPFLRAGKSEGTTTLMEKSVAFGLGYYGRNTDLAGIGFEWGEAPGGGGQQRTVEAFYRFSISPGFQITPSIQYIDNPLAGSTASSVTVLGLRTRVVF